MNLYNKIKKLSILFLIIILIFNLSTEMAFGESLDDLWSKGWTKSGKPQFTVLNSDFVKKNDVTYNGRMTTIMKRLRSSYSYRERRPQIANSQYMQNNFYSYDSKLINSVDFTNITYTNRITPDNSVGYTHWYDSPFGIFLDYETRYIKQPPLSTIQGEERPTDAVQDSIDYNKVLKVNGLLQPGCNSAYLTSTAAEGELADAKIGSVLGKNQNKRFPIYLNNGKSIDSKVLKELEDNKIKNLYILGGDARFYPLAGLTGDYNIVRAGGYVRNDTEFLFENLPNIVKDPGTYDPLPDGSGIVIGGYQKISNAHKSVLKTLLQNEKNIKDTKGLQAAATYILDNIDVAYGRPNENSKPAIIIGVNDGFYETYWICYYSIKKGEFVYQYVLNNFNKSLESTVNIEYRDIDTNNIIKPTFVDKVTHTNNTPIEKTYSAPIISGYDYNSSKVTSGGVTSTSTNPAKISVKLKTTNKVVFYYKQRKNVNVTVEYRDIDTNKSLRTPLSEAVSIILDKPVEKTYSAPVISGYDYNSSKITSGGATSTGTNPAKISIKPTGINKVIFYYKKSAIKDVGIIKFNPNETSWTNKGKISEGKGKYEVEVSYEGNNPIEDVGRWEKINAAGEVLAGTFPVKFELKDINVTGATNTTINGVRGKLNIEQEGENLKLNGVGNWKDPSFSSPEVPYELPDPPKKPVGESGFYNIDWTRTDIKVTSPNKKWINSPLPYKIDIKVNDNLSGFAKGSKVTVSDNSHYKNNSEEDINNGDLVHNRAVMLFDGIYDIDVKADDIAGNEHTETYKSYYVDGTTPEVSFNMDNKIFSEENGAIRKPSDLGNGDALYGTLTAKDNLSGIKTIDYKWTYGSTAPTEGYTNIYSSEVTFNDRHTEIITKEVEKPVGDNLYLHIKGYDVAGNYIYKSYGPYEDPIKLKNFQVTDIRDPRWTSVFWKDDNYKDYTGKTFKVNEMAIDHESHPTLKNALPKKGYAFYFDITSEYLYRDNDRIEVKPNFYYINGNERIRVDCYYNNNNNPLVAFGSKLDDSTINLNTNKYGDVLIGNYSKLILTKGVRTVDGREWKDENGTKGWKDEIQYIDGKEQYWYGKYFIPSSTFCVKAGDEPIPMNRLSGGNILINFEITAYKNGIETFSTDQMFNYTIEQWALEGGSKNSNYKNGDVILYNGKYGADTDIKTRVIH